VDKWVSSAKKHSNRLFLLNHWRLKQLRTGEDRPERWYATADTADLAAATDGPILLISTRPSATTMSIFANADGTATSMMTERAFHSLAECFQGTEFEELVADIAKNGLHHPIVLYEQKILDGRNRYLACKQAAIEPRFTEYPGDDAAGDVVSINLRRRHLNESQRGMIAAKLANVIRGSNRYKRQQNQHHTVDAPTGASRHLER
jgi:hypothetical protein